MTRGQTSKDTPMTTLVSPVSDIRAVKPASRRAEALAERLEKGAGALAAVARSLGAVEWQTGIPGDGRTVGVIVHHVATMYPLEIQLAQTLAAGNAVAGVTWEVVHRLNAAHA